MVPEGTDCPPEPCTTSPAKFIDWIDKTGHNETAGLVQSLENVLDYIFRSAQIVLECPV